MIKVMIVDDEPNIRNGLSKIIDWGKSGFVVSAQAEDGIEALELFNQVKPDLVITDIKMPGMDGIRLTHELKKRNPDVRIIILSGYSDFNYAKEVMKHGAEYYLLKPINQEELISALSEAKEKITKSLVFRKSVSDKQERIKDYLFIHLMNGIKQEEVMKQLLTEYNINVESTHYCVAILFIDLADDAEAQKTHNNSIELISDRIHYENEQMIFKLNNLLNEQVNGYVFKIHEQQYGMIMLDRSQQILNREMVNEVGKSILKLANDLRNTSLTLGIGTIVSSRIGIAESYKEAVIALERKVLCGVGKLYFFEAVLIDSNHVKNILVHINEHYMEDLSIKKVADLFFINAVYLGQLFRSAIGENFHDYLNKIRIKNAQKLIVETNLSICEFANRVGYKHIEHFYRIFKEIIGFNPGELRKSVN